MKSSSPSCKKTTSKSISSLDDASEGDDAAYHNWVKKYPSALALFDQIIKYANDKKIAMFMDYDGTLSPIVNNPDHAFMSSAMRAAVKNIANFFPTAIISGRSRHKVYEFVGLEEIYYAGSHGMDIGSPHKQGKNVQLFQPASEFLAMIDEVFRSLVKNMKDIKGSRVENNKFCLSVHYRQVDENSWNVIAERVQNILNNYPLLKLTYGKKVLEIRPIINWNKGTAVEFLLESLGLNDQKNVLPIYIGDDLTDEDAFKVLREKKWGYGILVSSVPKKTSAHFSLKDPSEVLVFLTSLVRWKRSQMAVHRS